MKRLTKKIDNGRFVTTDAEARSYGETDPEDGFFYNYFTGEAVDKLAAYEDTGLEPADVEALLAKDKNVPDKNVGKWISVEERLPEQFICVFATDGEDVGIAAFQGFIDDYPVWSNAWNLEYIEDQYDEDFLQVTHWMPLPEPPKEATSDA